MDNFLFNIFKLIAMGGYLFISGVLLYNQLLERWMKFSFGFFVLYGLSSVMFFGILPFSFLSREFAGMIPYILFFVSPLAVIGIGLFKGLEIRQIVGVFMIYILFLVFFLIGLYTIFGISFGTYFGLSSLTRQWIELFSLLGLVGGSIFMYGYCCNRGMEGRETFGVLLMFLTVMLVIFAVIQGAIGFEYVGRSFRAGGLWFPGLNM